MNALIHEIGHMLVDYGHPDQGGGHAALPGTYHRERLMRSSGGLAIGPGGIRLPAVRGARLVKREWDEAENWLKKYVDDPNQ